MNSSNPRRREITARVLVVMVPLVFGLGLTVWSVGALRRAAASRGWPSTEGKVVSAVIGDQEEYRSGGDYFAVRPNISYEYEVDGVAYASERISFG